MVLDAVRPRSEEERDKMGACLGSFGLLDSFAGICEDHVLVLFVEDLLELSE